MKLKTAIKRIEKLGLKLNSDKNGQYWVKLEGSTLAFYAVENWEDPQGEQLIDLINITHTDLLAKDTCYANGNCYTTYFDNLTQCIKSFCPLLLG